MKTTLSLSTKQSTSSSICKSCKRELPLESFYMNKKTQSPEILQGVSQISEPKAIRQW